MRRDVDLSEAHGHVDDAGGHFLAQMFGPAVSTGSRTLEGLAADEVERFREFLSVCVGEAPARVTADGGPVAGNVRVEPVAIVFDLGR